VPDELLAPVEGQALIYATADGTVRVEVIFQDETFWLSQRRTAELFGVDVRTVNEHLKGIYESGELTRDSTIRKFRRVQREGSRDVSRWIDFYNLDAVVSVGYRVNSRQATQFRIWATQTLKAFIVKGFVLDDERLKQGARFGKDYFDELLERIVSMYLDYAENQAARHRLMRMVDWAEKLDDFLRFNEYDVLSDTGRVSREVARELAEGEYDTFRVLQDRDYEGDFEREVQRVLESDEATGPES